MNRTPLFVVLAALLLAPLLLTSCATAFTVDIEEFAPKPGDAGIYRAYIAEDGSIAFEGDKPEWRQEVVAKVTEEPTCSLIEIAQEPGYQTWRVVEWKDELYLLYGPSTEITNVTEGITVIPCPPLPEVES